jgi:hypothetical protein
MDKMKKEQRIKRIRSKITTTRSKQVGNIRFEESVYNEVVKIAKGLEITKQYLVEQIVKDFLIED